MFSHIKEQLTDLRLSSAWSINCSLLVVVAYTCSSMAGKYSHMIPNSPVPQPKSHWMIFFQKINKKKSYLVEISIKKI